MYLTEVRSSTYLISSDHTNSSLSWSCLITDSLSFVLKIIVELKTLQLDVLLKFIPIFHYVSHRSKDN